MHTNYPEFLFVCGAVGSGNTFLFRSLVEDPQVYGLNEADIGGFIKRLVDSEQGTARCPHALGQFLTFLQNLRAGRATLIEKSPSNIRHKALIQELLPNSRFLYTLREPRAAIVSGLFGRAIVPEVEHVAKLWREDTRRMLEQDSATRVMVYERFLASPREALERMATDFLPLSQDVVRFATRVARTGRADPQRWKERITAEQVREVEHWVAELHLDELYREVAGDNTVGLAKDHAMPVKAWRRHVRRLSAPGFTLWYRLKKPLRARISR